MSDSRVPEVVPGSSRLRVTVERVDHPTCDVRVGDFFEVDGTRLLTPGGGFCPFAIAAVIPVLPLMQGDLPADSWLIRKPYICCPDARENVVMRISAEPVA